MLRDGGVNVSAAAEDAVVSLALDPLMTSSSELTRVDGLWAIVVDGREVALALPERNGDGSWVVHDVRVCGAANTLPAAIDGSLDCASDVMWGMQGSPDPSVPGEVSAAEAVNAALETYQTQLGGEIRFQPPSAGTLIIDQREQIVVRASKVPAGGWSVMNAEGCEGIGN